MVIINRKLFYKKIKKIIIKFLLDYHKKFNLYKINLFYFYLLYFISNIYSINKYYNNKIKNKYQLIYLYIYFLNIFRIKMNLDLNICKLYNFFILCESYNFYDITNLGNDFFSINKDYIILNSLVYKLRINLWLFMLYGKKIEYIIAYYYNIYLSANILSLKYPLINIILRFLLRHRFIKLVHTKKFKYSKSRLLEKYRINNFLYLSNKDYDYLLNYNIFKFFLNTKFLKLFNILSNVKLFFSTNLFWSKLAKIDFLLNVFMINVNNDADNCLDCEYNKFSALGFFALYWQLNRYGFKIKQRYYYFNLYKDLLNNYNLNNIILYNNYYLKFLLKKNFFDDKLIFYKLKNFIILIYVRKFFFKYLRFNKFFFKRRISREGVLKDWFFLIKLHNLIFFPLNSSYYDNLKLKDFFIKSKKYIDNLYTLNIFNYNFKKYQKYNISFLNIIKNLLIDKKISYNYYIIKNYFINILYKKIEKYFYINLLNLLISIKNINNHIFLYNISYDYSNLLLNKNYIIYEDNINKYNFFYLRSRDKFFYFYYLYEYLYLWDFEKSLLYNMYIKYMHHTILIISRILFSIIKIYINYFNSIKINSKDYLINLRLDLKNNPFLNFKNYFYKKYKHKFKRKSKKKRTYNKIECYF